MKLFGAIITSLTTFTAFATAQVGSLDENGRPTNYTAYYFDQLIDHFQDSPRYAPNTNATFTQRYYFDNTYYKPGGPVFLYIGGETSGPSRFSNLQTGIIQILMNATGGLGVVSHPVSGQHALAFYWPLLLLSMTSSSTSLLPVVFNKAWQQRWNNLTNFSHRFSRTDTMAKAIHSRIPPRTTFDS